MPKDGVIVDINTKAFEMALYKMGRKDASKVLYQAVSAGGRIAKKQLQSDTPESKAGTSKGRRYEAGASGFKLDSRNHPSGTLRDSVKFALKKRARARSAFYGALIYQEDRKKKFYGKFVVNSHSKNAFGYKGGNDVMSKSVQKSRSKVKARIEKNLIFKFTKYYQQFL
jgi:hypothetical protein